MMLVVWCGCTSSWCGVWCGVGAQAGRLTRGRTRFDTFAKRITTNTIISTATNTIISTFANSGLSVQVLGLARIFQQMTFDSCNMMTLVAKDKKLTRVNTARARFSLSLSSC